MVSIRSRAVIGGFTLLEAVIILLALAIAAALAAPRLSNASTQPSDLADVRAQALESHLLLFRERQGRFPTAQELRRPPADPERGSSFGVLVDAGYVVSAPVNPRTTGDVVGIDWHYDAESGRIRPVTP
ncbi:MAG: hypothetical protein AAGI53_12475 [Planctomycetota bacterium]